MSLVAFGLVLAAAGGAALVTRSIRRKREASEPAASQGEGSVASVGPDRSVFGCAVGDVVVPRDGSDAWLSGALVFSEDVPVCALFVAPDAGVDRAVFTRTAPNRSMVWLERELSTVLPPGTSEPPFVLEVAGTTFERTRRLPLTVASFGSHVPAVRERAIVAEYEAAGAKRLVVVSSEEALVYRGVELDPDAFEVVPSGTSTLE